MSNPAPLTFTIHGLGEITMKGTGPWSLVVYSHASVGIIDSTGVEQAPWVRSKARLASNVIFAQRKDAEAVIAKANELLLATQP